MEGKDGMGGGLSEIWRTDHCIPERKVLFSILERQGKVNMTERKGKKDWKIGKEGGG